VKATWEPLFCHQGTYVAGISLEPLLSVSSQGKTEEEARKKVIDMAAGLGYEVEYLKIQLELF